MSRTINNFTIGSISGGVATGPSAQAVGAGGKIVNHAPVDLATVLAAVRSDILGAPAEQKAAIEGHLAGIEAEAAKPVPNRPRIDAALRTIRSISEGTAGSLIAAYLGTLSP